MSNSICRQCGSQIGWSRPDGRWTPVNLDGSPHFDTCKTVLTEKIKKEGTPFENSKGSGYVYKGRHEYFIMKGPRIVGPDYVPAVADGLPWD